MAGYFSKEAQAKRQQRRLNNRLFTNDIEKFKKALARGAEIHSYYDGTGNSPLHFAVINNHEKIVELMISLKVNPDFAGKDRDVPVIYDALSRGHDKIAQMLLDAGADIHVICKDRDNRTCFHAAAGELKTAKIAFAAGLDINARDDDGETPLHIAARSGRKDLVEFMLENGADPFLEDKHGRAPIERVQEYNPQIKRVLQDAMNKARKQAEKKHDAQSVLQHEGWHKASEDEIWHVGIKKDMGYSITRIFNFHAQTVTQIARNLETNAESQTLVAFQAIDDGNLILEAAKEMEKAGGKVDFMRLDKPRLGSTGSVL